ncbi:MAG TPA: hypothetical protein VGQ30_10090 [Gemmatimonadaceae bacterium]|jgi:hypothetical protein|nr:hypothetical protein [Gemmatimonadaceae bacterium]
MRTVSSNAARFIACALFIGGMVACGRYYDSPYYPPGNSAIGEWGNQSSDVIVTHTSTHVTVSCSFGDFPGEISLDQNGRFTINGSWNRSTGPIQLNGAMPAQMSGQVYGNEMTFAIAVNDTVAKQVTSIGPVIVDYGRAGGRVPCPL